MLPILPDAPLQADGRRARCAKRRSAPRRASLAVLVACAIAPAGVAERAAASEAEATAAPTRRTTIRLDENVGCAGVFMQGGMAVCRGEPGTRIRIGEATTTASGENGDFVLGFDRDAPVRERVELLLPDGRRIERMLEIAPRRYAISRIDGLPPSQVDTFTKAELARIESSSARKRAGDASRAKLDGFREGFQMPLAGRRTSAFGAQRILNGKPKRPHFGVDLAAPRGTTIRAPATGIVTLADDDLYFEGAMIVIDHGQGFLSKYLHVSRIDVEVGQRVARGDPIGAVGARGRSTGPHLCWRLKWRDRNLDPELWLEPSARAAAIEAPGR